MHTGPPLTLIAQMAASKLAATILAPDAPPVPAVAPAINPADLVNSRKRLRGAIGRDSHGPTFFLFPDVESGLSASSKKLPISDDGSVASSADKTEAQVSALNIDSVARKLTGAHFYFCHFLLERGCGRRGWCP